MSSKLPLLAHHYDEWVLDSCVDPLLVNRNLKSLSGDEIYEHLLAFSEPSRRNDGRLRDSTLNQYLHCVDGGWWFTSTNIYTGLPSEYGCFKPDNPRENPENGKTIKYETPPNAGSQLFTFDVPDEIWESISVRYGVKRGNSSHFYQWLYNNPKIPLFITEGAKKTGCLLSQGYAAIGLNGWTGLYKRDGYERSIHLDIAFLLDNRERVYLAFDQDSDKSTKMMIHKGLRRFTHLVDQDFPKVTVFKVSWPAAKGKGVDDFVKAEGTDALHHQVKLARKLKTLEPDKKTEYLERDSAPHETIVELSFPEKCYREIYQGGRYISCNKTLYRYNGKYYEEAFEENEWRRIREWAMVNPELVGKKWVLTWLSDSKIESIWAYVLKIFRVTVDELNPPGLNLDNGTLRLRWNGRKVEYTLAKHSPDDYYIYCSKVKFNKNAPTEKCDQLLSCLDPVQQTVFLRSIACAFDPEKVKELKGRPRALLCEGKGSNGKDSLQTAIELIFSTGIAALTFEDFKSYERGRKFPLECLGYSRISWSAENNINASIDKISCLRIAISGEALEMEGKNTKGKYIKPNCIFLFNINGFPSLSAGMTSILNRWAVLTFRKTFAANADPNKGEIEVDPRFRYDKEFVINEVCPALINKLLVELQNYIDKGADYTALEGSLREIQENTDHLWGFCFDMGIEYRKDAKMYASDLWELLRQWYMDNGTLEVVDKGDGKTKNIWNEQANPYDKNCTAPNQLYRRFSALFPQIKRDSALRSEGNQNRLIFLGLGIKDSALLPSQSDTEPVSALPPALPCLISALPSSLEEEEKDHKNNGTNELKTDFGKATPPNGKAEVSQVGSQKSLHSEDGKAGRQESASLFTSPRFKKGDHVCLLDDRSQVWIIENIYDGMALLKHSECKTTIKHYLDNLHLIRGKNGKK